MARRTNGSMLSPRSRALLGGAALAAITAIAYVPALRDGGFIVDDDVLLTDSRLIRAPDGVYRFWFTTDPVDYWPLSNTSLWLEWRLWGRNPHGYHATNVALHVLTALLLWSLLRRLAIPGAYLAALLFALHPVNVESVAWIAQRKDLLALLLLLLSLAAYARYERAGGDRGPPDGGSADPSRPPPAASAWGWYALSIAAFALAMLSKVSAVVLPPLLLLMLAWLRPLTWRDLVRSVPIAAIGVALVLANLHFRLHDTGIGAPRDTLAERLCDAATVGWFYLWKALWPVGLVFIYPASVIRFDELPRWLPLVAAVVLALLLWRYHRRGALFAWLFFWLALWPVVGLTENLVIADHYQHTALIGVVALVAAGWQLAFDRAAAVWRGALLVAAAGAAAGLALLTWRQSAIYTDNVTLLAATVDGYPNSAESHHNLAYVLLGTGDPERARAHLEIALRLSPTSPGLHKTLGAALAHSGRFPEAIAELEQALRLTPDDPGAHHDLGAVLRESGRTAEAIPHLRRAVELKPGVVKAHTDLGKALFDVGDAAGARAEFEQALRIDPTDAEAQRLLAATDSR